MDLRIWIITICIGLSAAHSVSADETPRTIQVTGNAEVRVMPDEVVLTLGVQTQDAELSACKERNDSAVKDTTQTLKEFNIPTLRIQCDFLDIRPTYRDDYRLLDLTGYTCRQSLVVVFDDTSKVDEILTTALKHGASTIHGVEFRTTKLREHRDHARSLAIKAAKEKAKALAGELNQSIGEPRSIVEQSSGWQYWGGYSWWNSWYGRSSFSSLSQNVVYEAPGQSQKDDAVLALGAISITATVNVTFELISGSTK